jgi:hypothetical protein
MKIKFLIILLLPGMGFISCKKESTSTTTRDKLLGKWNSISEITNDYNNGVPHISTYNFSAGDYMEFNSNWRITQYQSGSSLTYDYGIIDESMIWMVIPGKNYEIKVLSASDLQLYSKTVSGSDYSESTLILKK